MELHELGWDEHFEAAHARAREELGDGLMPARVMADFGVELRVVGEFGDERAVLVGRLRFDEGQRPAVGDFVAVTGEPQARVVVHVYPRRSWLARQAAGEKTAAQMIGANLDVVFVVTSFNQDLNLNRIERYLLAVREGGANPVVLVNKSDLVDEEERRLVLEDVSARLPSTPVLGVSAHTDDGLRAVLEHLGPARTGSFVGSSGVGKSSILNRLLGDEQQRVQETRSDAKGRHTTTHRELFVLPDGSLILDTPGMREFQLWDEVAGRAFEDIEALAAACRFRDCQHDQEPGCAVVEAVDAGALAEARLESWRKLQRETRANTLRQSVAARRAESKKLSKTVREAGKKKRRK